MSENDLLSRLPQLFRTDDPSVIMGSGPDDCAHVRIGEKGGILSISTDAFVEGSHFLPDADPRDVACKSLSASLSDLAASACMPRWAVISLCLRPGLAPGWAESFANELAAVARRYRVAIIGGDTVSSKNGVFVSLTVMGEPLPGGPILRDGARPGDAVVVTGELGGSILGKHLRPVPRFKEMEALMRFCGAMGAFPSAAMDISDGLAIDLTRLCRESGVGAVIDAERVPVSPQASSLASQSGKEPLEHALTDGEDFELLITMNSGIWDAFSGFLARNTGPGNELAGFARIGEITAEPAITLRRGDGSSAPLHPKGYEHTW